MSSYCNDSLAKNTYTAKIAKYILYIFSEIYILCIKYIHKMHRYRNIYFAYAKNILKMYILNI